MSNLEAFKSTYLAELLKEIAAKPDEYAYSPDLAPGVVSKFAAAFSAHRAVNMSNPLRRTARKLGIKPTLDGFHNFVKEQN